MRELNRILVIRGGAIGDFILTLPALKALREAHPRAHIEILGYKHIAALAENRFYAQAVRSIEYGPLSSFFAKDAKLPSELANYFASFDLILSYLYDPDGIFENNLRRCRVRRFVRGPGKIGNHKHAALQLAEPIESLGLEVGDAIPKLYPLDEDRQFAREFLRDCVPAVIAIHPGSGSGIKNWPIENWIQLGNDLLGQKASRSGGFPAAELPGRRSGDRRSLKHSIVIVSGEADEHQIAILKNEWKGRHVHFANNLPLPHLASVLEQTIFVGHDSGISHLAAATGADCILIFGPTDPGVWAPLNNNVRVIRAASGRLEDVDPAAVRDALDQALIRIGMRT
ncbi:MAG: glycosyltransferase family 9 protein [Verrucomicrobiota bacterium]|nr:glycosyltransferase family 9 protein [Verrucomicrobiota bacterium]